MRLLQTALAAAVAAIALPASAQSPSGPISPERLSAHVKVLADSKLAGRAPGGPGEPATLDYLIGQFKARGLRPAGD